jgi:DNA-binding response OmpR family regulator
MIDRSTPDGTPRRRMILACASSAHAALAARHFRRHGWEVHLAVSGPDARELTYALAPEIVLLDTQLPGESGWLTCAKFTMVNAGAKVILVSPEVTEEEERLAELVGAAALVGREGGVPQFGGEAERTCLPHAV